MAENITKTFTYAIPDEQWVEGNLNTNVEFTYEGPPSARLIFGSFGDLHEAATDRELESGEYEVTVDFDANPEIGEVLKTTLIEDLPDYVEENEEVDMGEDPVDHVLDDESTAAVTHKYRKVTNPRLMDNFDVIMDMTDNSVGLVQIVKPLVNDGVEAAKNLKERMVFAKAKIRFSTEIDTAIDEYVTALDTYIANTPAIHGWKYEVIPSQPAPPDVPAAIRAELTKFGA